MPKDFDDILSDDREFKVRGETFHYRDVRPEVLSTFTMEPNGDEPDPNFAWKLADAQILLFLPEDEHSRWRELREREENPVTIAQLNSILTWLMEIQTDRPTVTPSPSASGRGRTAASSKGV